MTPALVTESGLKVINISCKNLFHNQAEINMFKLIKTSNIRPILQEYILCGLYDLTVTVPTGWGLYGNLNIR
jgi:hypothetical protein